MMAMPIGGTNPATPGIPIDENLTLKGIISLYIIVFGASTVLKFTDAISL
jgi:hypothetical protein